MRLVSFGHGYVAQRVAQIVQGRGAQVVGTTRSASKAEALRSEGIEAHVWSGGPAPFLEGATHVLSSIPPVDGQDIVAPLLAERELWAGYFSTTGVYGNRDGGWVDETSELRPDAPVATARVGTERDWLALPQAQVFRLGGIYGPGRSPFDRLRAGTARRIVKPGQVFSRVHVDDITRGVVAAMEAPRSGWVVNMVDDLPAPPQDVVAYAAQLLGVAPPPEVPFEDADLSPMARGFYSSNKRARNDRLHDLVGDLLYPTYREGLTAVLAAGG